MTEAIIVKTVGDAPRVQHHGDAGGDLTAAEDMWIEPGEYEFIGTNTSVALPIGYVGYVMSRSGLARKHGVHVLNAPGVVDSGYRGEIGVILKNDGSEGFAVHEGDRIAQFIVQQHVEVAYVAADSLDESARGNGGFGSTGVETSELKVKPGAVVEARWATLDAKATERLAAQ